MLKFTDLIYPEIDAKIVKKDTKYYIFDILRKKYLLLTPEEWVRQHLLHYLIFDRGYSRALIKAEANLQYNKKLKRPDLVIYNAQGEAKIIAECKAPEVRITQDVLYQISIYANVLRPDFLILTNGVQEFVFLNNGKKLDIQKEIPLCQH